MTKSTIFFVAVTELSERICVMGIATNLVTYLVGDLHISSAKSATIVTNFMGTLNLLGLFAGFLADAKLGRYLTVAIFATITALVRFEPNIDSHSKIASLLRLLWREQPYAPL